MEIKRTQVHFEINFTSDELKVVGKALALATIGGRLKEEREAMRSRTPFTSCTCSSNTRFRPSRIRWFSSFAR